MKFNCNIRDFKKSDTIVIYGCGYSINDLTEEDKISLSHFDSIGFNFFCFSLIPTTYYIIREQANTEKRRSDEENSTVLYDYINKYYKKSCLIIHDISSHSPSVMNYSKEDMVRKFHGSFIIVNDIKLENNRSGVDRWRNTNIISDGVIHGKCTLNNACHISINLGYRNIIFVGVDLYDSRYFWLGPNETRFTVSDKKLDYSCEHPTSKNVLSMVSEMIRDYPDISISVYNKKSLLSSLIPVWRDK